MSCEWNWVTQRVVHVPIHFTCILPSQNVNSRIAKNHLWTLTALLFFVSNCKPRFETKTHKNQYDVEVLKYIICTLQTPKILAAKMKRKKRRSHFWYIERQMLIFISTLKRFWWYDSLLIAVSVSQAQQVIFDRFPRSLFVLNCSSLFFHIWWLKSVGVCRIHSCVCVRCAHHWNFYLYLSCLTISLSDQNVWWIIYSKKIDEKKTIKDITDLLLMCWCCCVFFVFTFSLFSVCICKVSY